jgi:predicted AlkP superfamily phosphohydrolase/phosphomutase
MNLPDIDWQRTQAFVAENVNTIRLNVRDGVPDGQVTSGRSYEELQQYLIEELEKLTDPETGQRLIEAVLRREDLYQGPYAHLAPDLLVVPRDYAYHVSKKLLSSRNPSVFTNQGAWQGTTGTHRRGGILILRGPGVQPGVELHGAKITDVVPTLLYLLDLPLPDDLDGTILTPALDEELVRDRLPRSCAGEVGESPEADQESAIYGGDEAELMEQRLRDLGYVE